MKNKFIAGLVLITILGGVLRLTALEDNPPSLNWDEVSHGYNAYSILKTGKDEWGKAFPLANFRAYGDYPLPLNLYITIPFIWAFGLNAFSIRLPHAILGTLTIFTTYFLTYGVTKKKNLSLFAALLVAIEPWYVFPSRFVLQSNLSVLFLTAAGATFFNREKNKYLLPLSFLLLGLTLFSYHSTRIFSPLFLVALLMLYRNELVRAFKRERKIFYLSLVALVLLFAPLPFILANHEARARTQVVFLIDEGAIGKIIESRQTSSLPPFLSKLAYNKPTYFAKRFLQNYFEYFSPQFLFLRAGTQYQFSVPEKGLSYLINLPFFYLGLAFLIIRAFKGEKNYRVLFAWLLLAPIPASVTQEEFAVIRSTAMLPLPQVLIAVGGFASWDWWKSKVKNRQYKNAWKGATVLIYFVSLAVLTENYLSAYFTKYRLDYSWVWQYGYREVVDFTKKNYAKYDTIVVTKKYGEPHEFFLFYWPWDPKKYQNDPDLIRFFQTNWYWVDRFDKFYFVNDWDIPKMENGKWKMENGAEIPIDGRTLLITSPGNFPPGWIKLRTIEFLDGKSAFDILEKT